jgi:hypothetical protein
MASDRRGERGTPAHPLEANGRRRRTGRGGGLDGAGRRGGVVGRASVLMEIDGLWGGGGIQFQTPTSVPPEPPCNEPHRSHRTGFFKKTFAAQLLATM